MPRSYRHIKQYEKELLELKTQGITIREIGEKFGFSCEQAHNFFKRYNRNQRKIKEGQTIYKKGDHQNQIGMILKQPK